MAIICAEIGQNWCADFQLALNLIDLAKENGADLVKFQLYDSKKLYGEKQNTELTFENARTLFDYGAVKDIEVFFSVFDIERVKWCEEIGVQRYKIAARTNDKNLFFYLAHLKKPVIISYDPKYDKYGWDISWQELYCVSKYPAELKDLKFGSGLFEDTGDVLGSSDGRGEYHRSYDGFSDHTIGLTAAKVALARGAQIIEKHFALTHGMGIDAPWSMTPEELRELKNFEREVRQIL